MSGQELQPSFREKLEILKKEHFPFVERSEVIEAIYSVPDLGPMDWYAQGAPIYLKTYLTMLLSGVGLGASTIANLLVAKGQVYIHPYYLLRFTAVGILSAFFFLSGIMWIFISMNKGTFSDYKRVIDYIWLHLDRRPAKRGELRVKRIVQIWPRESKIKADELEKSMYKVKADELEKSMYKDLLVEEKQLMALAGMTPELERSLTEAGIKCINDVASSKIDTLKKVRGINDDFASLLIAQSKLLMETKTPDEEDEINESELTEMEKASSLYRMRRMMKRVKGLQAVPKARDIAKEGISLRHEFIRLARSIDSDKVYTVLECAGDLYVLVISKHPLTGGDDDGTATSKQVEFKDHEWSQRTYVWAATNQHATWGIFTHLADYKYYLVPDAKARGIGKEAAVKHAPIVWLSYSDGQAERDNANVVGSRLTPSESDIIQGSMIYDASLSEKLLERDKLLTQTISRVKEEARQIWRDATDWAKNTIAKAVEKILLEEKLRESHGKWNVKLFSKYAIRAFTIICVAFVVYLIVALILNTLVGASLPLPWGTGNEAGGLPGGGSDVGGGGKP